MSLLSIALSQIQLPPNYGERDREEEYASRKEFGNAVRAANARPMEQRKAIAVAKRAAILTMITARPGIGLADLINDGGFSRGGLAFHINSMLEKGEISKRIMKGKACYFPAWNGFNAGIHRPRSGPVE